MLLGTLKDQYDIIYGINVSKNNVKTVRHIPRPRQN